MRRRMGRAVLVVLLLTALTSGAPSVAGAQQLPPGTISVKPNCSDSTTTWVSTISGTMPLPNGMVGVDFDGQRAGTGATDGQGRYSVNLTVPAEAPGSYTVSSYQIEPRSGRPFESTRVSSTFRAPCPQPPSITITPDCSDARAPGTWAFVATGGMPTQTIVNVIFDFGGDEVVFEGFATNFRYRVEVSVPARSGAATFRVAARHQRDPVGSLVETTFRSPCSVAPPDTTTTTRPPEVFAPVLVFSPAVGPEGSATTLVGTGWPPGTAVAIAGNVALSEQPVADAAGNFSVAAVLLPNSGLGERVLTGSAPGANAAAAFLVVPSTMQPPRFLFR